MKLFQDGKFSVDKSKSALQLKKNININSSEFLNKNFSVRQFLSSHFVLHTVYNIYVAIKLCLFRLQIISIFENMASKKTKTKQT